MADAVRLMLGDCLERMREIEDGSVNLIATDPPYYKCKSDAWDRQWKTPGEFLEWMGRLCAEWRRVLAPNGSLYVFASPQMAARVECKIGETFAVINRITWRKPPFSTKAEMFRKEDLRSFFPASEAIIFAEHFGADSMALGESGYAAKCEALRGFVFEPIRAYLDGERERAGLTPNQVNVVCGFREQGGMAGRHWFNASQFAMPTEKAYAKIQATTGCFDRHYGSLRSEYEDLRRPFSVSASVPYTDVWDFPTVPHRPGKHPCQKPLPLLSHIITASSRPGDTILDPFMGSGVSGESAISLGRRFVGIEQDPKWFDRASKRIDKAGNPARAVPPERTLFSMTG